MRANNRLPDISEQIKDVIEAIRSPLDSVAANAELILRENTNSKINNSAYDINVAVRELTRIRDDVKDLIGILLDDIELNEDEYDFEEAALFLRSKAEERTARKGTRLTVSIDKKLPARLYGDVDRITGILGRLLKCAVEAAGAGRLQFFAQNIAEKDDLVYLKFDVSYSGDSSLTTEFKSVLLIAQRLASQMGGKLTAEFGGSNKNKISMIIAQRKCSDERLEDKAHDFEYVAGNENAELDAQTILQTYDVAELKIFLNEAPAKADLAIHYLSIRDYRNCIRTFRSLSTQAEKIGAKTVTARVCELADEAKYGNYNQTMINMQEFSNYIQRFCNALRNGSEEAAADIGHAIIDNGNLIAVIDEINRNLSEYNMERVEELYFSLSQLNSDSDELMELLSKGEEELLNLDIPELKTTLMNIRQIIA
ncbi:MAG: hypothetical protein MJ131_04790 [Lachnospiraceae bacterium]|nr:hypothetical protein [Lachnospiraceae bacterium]